MHAGFALQCLVDGAEVLFSGLENIKARILATPPNERAAKILSWTCTYFLWKYNLLDIATIYDVRVANKEAVILFKLNGLEEKILNIRIIGIDFNEKTSKLKIGMYHSDTEFIKNLSKYFPKEVGIPDGIAFLLTLIFVKNFNVE